MIRSSGLITAIAVFSTVCSAQNMDAVFRKLPLACTPGLSAGQRDSLILNGNYVPNKSDPSKSIRYEKRDIHPELANNYCKYSMNIENRFYVFELKRYKRRIRKDFVIFARCGGLFDSYSQQEFKIYTLKGDTLIENSKQTILPETPDISAFLKKETPDSVKTKIAQSTNLCYDLEGQLTFRIYTKNNEIDELFQTWRTTLEIVFLWNGSSFQREKK